MKNNSEKQLIFARKSSGMIRELSWIDVFIMSMAAPAASGILYYSVNTQSSYPGGSIWLAFIIGLIIFLPISYVISMLATAMPRAGSLYVAVSRLMDSSVGYIGAYLYFIGQALIAGVLGNIITAILGGIFISISDAYSILFLKGIGEAFQTSTGTIIGGCIWVLIFWAVTLGGIKIFRRFMQFFFYIPLAATLLTIIIFIFTSSTGAVEAFNQTWGAGAYQGIIETAKVSGWTESPFSFESTLALLLVVLWAYNGIDMGSYAGSEVQSPKKSFVKGVILGWLFVGVLYVLLSFAVVKPFGEFIGAYDFLAKNNQEGIKSIMPFVQPSVPFYLISIMPNKLIGILLSLTIVMWFVNSIPPIFISTSRILFALSMDRTVPEKLANVNDKNGAPIWATHLTAIVAILGVVFQTFNVTVVLGTLLFCTFFIFWMYGFSAMVLPFYKPKIYEQLSIKTKIAGVPLLSIGGFLTFGIGWYFVFLALREITLPVAFVLAIFLLIGVIIYYSQIVKNSKREISIKELTSEMPPE